MSFNSDLIKYELREYWNFSRKIFRAHKYIKSYVTFTKESIETVAVYHEFFSAQILSVQVH